MPKEPGIYDVAILTVDGVKLPSPSEYEVTPQEITKSSRNARGDLFKFHLSWKRTIRAVWYAVDASMMRTIAAATDSEGRMEVGYYDPESGAIRTGFFYRGSDYKVAGADRFSWNVAADGGRSPAGHLHYRVEMSLVEY